MKSIGSTGAELTVPLIIAALAYQVGFSGLDLMLTGGISQDIDPSAVMLLFVGFPVVGTLIAIPFTWLALTVVYSMNWLIGHKASSKWIKSISTAVGMLPAWYSVSAIMGLENGYRFTYTHIWIAFTVAFVMGAAAPLVAGGLGVDRTAKRTGQSIAG